MADSPKPRPSGGGSFDLAARALRGIGRKAPDAKATPPAKPQTPEPGILDRMRQAVQRSDAASRGELARHPRGGGGSAKGKRILGKLAGAMGRWEKAGGGLAPDGYDQLCDLRPKSRLKNGSEGTAVKALQLALRQTGASDLTADGVFGDKTQTAVWAFQGRYGISEPDAVGPKTLAALDRALGLPNQERYGFEPERAPGALPETGNALLDRIAPGAVRGMRATGFPASVALAQAVLESGWGERPLARELGNLFGVADTDDGPTPLRAGAASDLPGGARPRTYDDPAESVADYMRVFAQSPEFRDVMAVARSPELFAKALARAYSTSRAYAPTLLRIIDQFDLGRFDRAAASG